MYAELADLHKSGSLQTPLLQQPCSPLFTVMHYVAHFGMRQLLPIYNKCLHTIVSQCTTSSCISTSLQDTPLPVPLFPLEVGS